VTGEPEACELLCLDLPKAEAARAGLPPAAELERWAAGAKSLGDPTRLTIAWALRESGGACVCDLGWIVGRDEKLVSHHLRLLRSSGLATSTRQGKMVMYELTPLGSRLLDTITTAAGEETTA
jgi:DNA-binding transcriptional ArsR family regulator